MYRYARPQAGRYREHRQFGVEVFGTEAAERRRRGDGRRRPVPARPGHRRVRGPGELDRRRDVPAGLPRGADRLPRGAPRPTDRRAPRPVRGRTRCGCSTARTRRAGRSPPRRRGSPSGCASRARRTSRPSATGWREAGARRRSSRRPSCAASTTTRARRSSSSRRGCRRSRGRCSAAAGTTGSPRRSAVRTCPGSGSAWGSSGCCWRSRSEGVEPPAEPPLGRLRRRRRRRWRRARRRSSRRLREAGVAADAAYEDRPMKAQMKQADRAGAVFAAIIGDREMAEGTVTLRRMADGEQASGGPSATLAGRRPRGGGRMTDRSPMATAMRTHACGELRADARAARRSRSAAGSRTGATTAGSRSSTCATARASSRSSAIPRTRRRPTRWRRPSAASGWSA